jgi:hypothetical protein
MRTTPSTTMLVILCATIVTAIAADTRFDGVWVGTETVTYEEMYGTIKAGSVARSTPAKIAIAQSGTLLGILEGWGTGRYNDVKRVGNTLVFHAGQRTGQLTLSADGNTLTEKGNTPVATLSHINSRQGAQSGGGPTPLYFDGKPLMGIAPMTGVFHRAK